MNNTFDLEQIKDINCPKLLQKMFNEYDDKIYNWTKTFKEITNIKKLKITIKSKIDKLTN